MKGSDGHPGLDCGGLRPRLGEPRGESFEARALEDPIGAIPARPPDRQESDIG